jgi:hypothetical protein
MTHGVDRRGVLALIAGAACAVASGGMALAATGGAPISAIRVDGRRTRTLAELAPMVAGELGTILGPRFQPGVRGGATLVIELTQVIIDDDDGGTGSLRLPFGRDSGVDQLQGHVTLIGPRRELLAEFPMLSSSGATFRSQLRAFPDPRRLANLARSFAWWTAGRLD